MTALRQLPAAQRSAVVLHHLVGLSVAEVAAPERTGNALPEGHLGTPVGLAAASAPACSFIPAEALLAPATLGTSWVRTASSRGPADLALDPCKTGIPDGATVVAHLSGGYSMQDASGLIPESAYFTQQIMRYPSATAAKAAAEAIRASVAQCPTTKDEGGSSRTWLTVAKTPLLVQVDDSQAGDEVNAPWYDYAGLTVAGDLVSTWVLGDPHGMSRPLADKTAGDVAAALCKTSGDC